MLFPSFGDIVRLNRIMIERHSGSFSEPYNMSEANAARLRSLLAKIEFPPIEHEMFEGAENLAAILGYDLATGHLFIDGNKRTAMAAMFGFLRINGVKFYVREREAEKMGWMLADRHESGVTREDLADWLRMIVRRAA